jgi:ERI1 exoribonuclease 3
MNNFDYLMVMDFEATGDCMDSKTWEIIEFPCVLVDLRQFKIIDKFREYVRPINHPRLSDVCKSVTKITQQTVDSADTLPVVLDKFYQWIGAMSVKFPNFNMSRTATVICGDWDLRTMLPAEVEKKGLAQQPVYLRQWINIKNIYLKHIGRPVNSVNLRVGMKEMLRQLKLPLVGQHHSGLDDCCNIASIAIHLVRSGCALNITSTLDA